MEAGGYGPCGATIDRLCELGYPVEGAPGVDGGYALTAGTSPPPFALDDEEAVALAVGLKQPPRPAR